MLNKRIIELLVGLFMLAGIVAMFVLAFTVVYVSLVVLGLDYFILISFMLGGW